MLVWINDETEELLRKTKGRLLLNNNEDKITNNFALNHVLKKFLEEK